jgi:glycosyltransferase involved in cell wall biosynthesis
MNKKVSIIIPSRNERFLNDTVKDILKKAQDDFEVIVILDEQDQEVVKDPRVKVHKKKGAPGLRSAINQGIDLAKGRYIMKLDGHCMMDEGFDVKLKDVMEDNWLVIPRRYSLSASNWAIKPGRPVIDYEFMAFPYRELELRSVRHGGKWYERAEERKELMLDEEMAFQGSCWFTTKKHYRSIGGYNLDQPAKDEFVLESEELGNKTWLSGGKCMVNKRTWYAHLHKGNRYGRGYFLNAKHMKQLRIFHIDYWMEDRWPKAIHKMEWLVEKFWPIPTWPEDWQDPKYREAFMESLRRHGWIH